MPTRAGSNERPKLQTTLQMHALQQQLPICADA
jgi:hypothetical protein